MTHARPPPARAAAQLLRDVRAYKKLAAAEGEEFDVVSLAARLSTIGYRVHVRNALGGGEGTACFHNLRHEFLIVQGEADHEGVDFIVEVRRSGAGAGGCVLVRAGCGP